jgi:uncharacterized protein with PIN domain
MKYLCDEMLGTLAKWLRIIGYDVCYIKGVQDKELIEKAHLEARILLTRDKDLAKACENSFYINSKILEEQLISVIRHFSLIIDVKKVLTRCTICNRELIPENKAEVRDYVPPYIFANHDDFWICRTCNRIYWKGSHVDTMISRLQKLNLIRDIY